MTDMADWFTQQQQAFYLALKWTDFLKIPYIFKDFPGGSVVKHLPSNAGDVDSMKKMATHFLPRKSHRHRSLEGYCPWGHKRVGHN